MNYPNGQNYKPKLKGEKKVKRTIFSAGNRGMNLESLINESNEFYRLKDIALITKRTTPIRVVKVDYTHGAKITDAYFEKQSTTDYNGVYKGRYIDFEAKSTKNKTSFPLNNIYLHQIEHLKKVLFQKGIAFFIINFEAHGKIYLLDAEYVIEYYQESKRRSIPYSIIKEKGKEIKRGLMPPLEYINIIDEKYLNS